VWPVHLFGDERLFIESFEKLCFESRGAVMVSTFDLDPKVLQIVKEAGTTLFRGDRTDRTRPAAIQESTVAHSQAHYAGPVLRSFSRLSNSKITINTPTTMTQILATRILATARR
jgi:hypothetical protein